MDVGDSRAYKIGVEGDAGLAAWRRSIVGVRGRPGVMGKNFAETRDCSFLYFIDGESGMAEVRT